MVASRLSRRRLLSSAGVVALTAMAGCNGDEASVEEVESSIEATNSKLEAVESKLETIGSAVGDEEWESCLDTAGAIRSDLDEADESVGTALEVARAGGFDDHATVLERQQEYIGIVREMADEIELTCQAGQDGRAGEAEEHWQTVQDLDEDRKAKRSEIEDALSDVR